MNRNINMENSTTFCYMVWQKNENGINRSYKFQQLKWHEIKVASQDFRRKDLNKIIEDANIPNKRC